MIAHACRYEHLLCSVAQHAPLIHAQKQVASSHVRLLNAHLSSKIYGYCAAGSSAAVLLEHRWICATARVGKTAYLADALPTWGA